MILKFFKENKIYFLFLFLFFSLFTLSSQASSEGIIDRLKGRILLQVEKNGEAWYLNPANSKRYYLGKPKDAFDIMKNLGIGISNYDFDNFQKKGFPKRLSGFILLTVEENGEAYYVNPKNLEPIYLGRPNDAFNIMINLSLGVKDKDLDKILIYKTNKDEGISNLADKDVSDLKNNTEIESEESNDKKENEAEDVLIKEDSALDDNTTILPPPIFWGGGSGGGSSYRPKKYNLKININGIGTESNYGEGLHLVEENERVTLKAVPAEFYFFVEWQNEKGQSLSLNNEYSFNMNSDKEIRANFLKNPKVINEGVDELRSESVILKGKVVQMGDITEGTTSFVFRKEGGDWLINNNGQISEPTAYQKKINLETATIYEYYTSLKWSQGSGFMSKDSDVYVFATPKIKSLKTEPERVYKNQDFEIQAEVENLVDKKSNFLITFNHGDDLIDENYLLIDNLAIKTATTTHRIVEAGLHSLRVGDKSVNIEVLEYPFLKTLSAEGVTNNSVSLLLEEVNIGLEDSVSLVFEYRVKGSDEWNSLDSISITENTSVNQGLFNLLPDTSYEIRAKITHQDIELDHSNVLEIKTKKTYTLNLSVIGSGVVTPSLGDNDYEEGAEVDLLAEANDFNIFSSWTGDVSTIESVNANSTKIILLGNYSVTAVFSPFSYEVSYIAGENGKIDDEASVLQTVNHGESSLAVIARPNHGYYFHEWSDGRKDNPRHDENVVENIYVTATFLPSFICGETTIFDSQNNEYKTTQINDQCWMAENLKSTVYNDGTAIIFPSNNTEWGEGSATQAYASWYSSNISNKEIYGALYNWNVVNDDKGICPTGWTVPSESDWQQLEISLGVPENDILKSGFSRGSNEGNILKSARTSIPESGEEVGIPTNEEPRWTYTNCSGTSNPCFGLDTYSFSVIPAGLRATHGGSNFINTASFFWSKSSFDESRAYFRALHSDRPGIRRDIFLKGNAMSIRCIKVD